jgi:hypothetical protein
MVSFRFLSEKKLTSAVSVYHRILRTVPFDEFKQFLHITLTRATAAFFLFSVLHCFAQGILQSFLYTIDSEHDSLVSAVLQAGQVPRDELAWLTRTNRGYKVQLCHDVPLNRSAPSCLVVFESGRSDIAVPPGFRRSVRLQEIFHGDFI